MSVRVGKTRTGNEEEGEWSKREARRDVDREDEVQDLVKENFRLKSQLSFYVMPEI